MLRAEIPLRSLPPNLQLKTYGLELLASVARATLQAYSAHHPAARLWINQSFSAK